jgi:transcriptional regulator with XRE-family HTH domain
MEELKTVGERIKYAADKSGIKQKIIAEKMNISDNSLTAYISGRRNIPDDKLRNFAIITGFSFNWLKTGVGEANDPQNHYTPISRVNYEEYEVSKALKEYLQDLLDNNRLAEMARVSLIIIKVDEIEKRNAELEKQLQDLQTEKGLN